MPTGNSEESDSTNQIYRDGDGREAKAALKHQLKISIVKYIAGIKKRVKLISNQLKDGKDELVQTRAINMYMFHFYCTTLYNRNSSTLSFSKIVHLKKYIQVKMCMYSFR